jgi:hypothetical protein
VQLGRELTETANSLIPGQAVLSAVESFVNPSTQEGLGSNVPGVSFMQPTRSSLTTGEPMMTRQKIFGLEIPAVRGVAFPGAVKVVNPVERALLDHGIAFYRPRRSPLLDLPAPDVPAELRREYEQLLGTYTKKFLTPIVTGKSFYNAPYEARKKILENMRSVANRVAKLELQKKHKSFRPAPERLSRRERLLPEETLSEIGVPE